MLKLWDVGFTIVRLLDVGSHKTLANHIRGNDGASSAYQKLLSLARLPEKNIPEQFDVISKEIDQTSKPLFTDFLSYYRNQWIKKVTAEKLCKMVHDFFLLFRLGSKIFVCSNVEYDQMPQLKPTTAC